MNKPLRRVISAALALSLSVTLAVNAYAEEIEKVHKHEAVSTEAVATKEKSEKAKKPEKTPITKDNLPEVLDFERVKGQGFVSRLKSEEKSLSEVVLEKEDGTRMLYLFEEDIKFHDNEGNIKDKSNKAVRKNNVFVGESNNIETVLPTSIMGGVSVSDESIEITMKPVSKLGITRFNSVGTINGENSVIYEDVFDSFTNLEYTFTYSGVKEDIILEKYTGNNTFSFEVTTGGLSLTEDKGTLVMKDENGEAKAVMSEIVVFSADNKNNTFGEYTIKEKIKNSLYIVEISVDKAYLADPNTVYPVTIDPTTISLQNGGTIEDMQVFNGTDGTGNTETSAGASGVSRVGWTDWGACRTLMKFKGSVNSAFNNITDKWQITNAYVEMRDLMCQSTKATINCSQFAGSNWDDAEQRTWNDLKATTISTLGDSADVFYGNGNPSDDRTLSDAEHWYNWDITNIVKGWVNNSSYRNKGIIFYVKNSSYEYSSNYANYMKTFCSIEGTASYRPYFCIEYRNPPTYVSTINCYYDNGYSVYYNETNANSKNKIKQYINSLSDIYYNLFNMKIVNNTVSYYSSPIDLCKGTVNTTNIDSLCNHSGTIHTDRNNVISSFESSHTGNDITTNMLWTCHKIHSIATNGEINYNRSCSYHTSVMMLGREIKSLRDFKTIGVLIHEMNHQYGAKDHYHELRVEGDNSTCKFKETCSECGINPRPKECIMYVQSSYDMENLICNGCKNDIISHLNNHHTVN